MLSKSLRPRSPSQEPGSGSSQVNYRHQSTGSDARLLGSALGNTASAAAEASQSQEQRFQRDGTPSLPGNVPRQGPSSPFQSLGNANATAEQRARSMSQQNGASGNGQDFLEIMNTPAVATDAHIQLREQQVHEESGNQKALVLASTSRGMRLWDGLTRGEMYENESR